MGWCRWRGWAAWLAAAGDPLSALAQGPPGGARSVDLGRERYDPRTVAQAAPLAPAAPVDGSGDRLERVALRGFGSLHPEMVANVLALPADAFAVVAGSGSSCIPGIEPGPRTVRAWTDRGDRQRTTATSAAQEFAATGRDEHGRSNRAKF